MRDFRSGKAPVMVATDVASRGLHIRGLPFIVNYDFPSRLGAIRASSRVCLCSCMSSLMPVAL